MNATRLIERMNRAPLKRLDIRLNDRTTITVEHPYQIATKRNSATCTVYDDDDDRMRIIAYRNTAKLATSRV